jgi:uncharacterized membrane protein
MRWVCLMGLFVFVIAGCGSPAAVVDPAPEAEADSAPAASETVEHDNSFRAHTRDRVSEAGGFSRELKVLYLEQRARYQWRYLDQALVRDRQLKYQGFLFDALDGWRQPVSIHAEDLRPLRAPFWDGEVVTDKQTFLDMGYDVVILGDICVVSGQWRREYWEWLEAFVQQGGGLILMAGSGANPQQYANNSIARRLYPVSLDLPDWHARLVDTTAVKYWGRTKPDHPLFAVSEDSQRRDELWGVEADGKFTRGQFRGLYWYHPTGGAAEGATVLARVANPGQPISEGDVLLATKDYGEGRVLWVGSADTWLWREFFGDHYFYKFWSNAIRHITKDGE